MPSATITVVTENDERTFNADNWNVANDKTLTIGDSGSKEIVAEYAPGGWQYVLRPDSEIPSQVQDSH